MVKDMIVFEAPPLLPWEEGPAWLLDEVRRFVASASMVDRFVGVGHLYRYWYAPPAKSDEEILQAFLQTTPMQYTQASAWARSLGAEVLNQLERWTVDAADYLLECADVLEETLERDTRAPEVLGWLLRLDDLESVYQLLAATGRGEALRYRLVTIREDVAPRSMWDRCAGYCQSRRLFEAAAEWPTPWWARFADYGATDAVL